MNTINLDKIITNAINEAVKKYDIRKKYPSKNKDFNLDEIPMYILDKGWQRYRPYTMGIPHGHPLSKFNKIHEGKNYLKEVQNAKKTITSTFPISDKQFIIQKGCHGLYAAILVSMQYDNIEVIENAMETLGFFRSQPTNVEILSDYKGRKWIDIRFEPTEPDDITDYLHTRYDCVYHLAPAIFTDKVLKNGLVISNNNSEFRYSEPRVFVTEGDITNEEIQNLVDTLFRQAAKAKVPNLSNEYTLFKIDLSKLDNSIRFFYDINEKKGLYTKQSIPPKAIKVYKQVRATTPITGNNIW